MNEINKAISDICKKIKSMDISNKKIKCRKCGYPVSAIAGMRFCKRCGYQEVN